jgi:hypothetical protein
MVWECLYSWDVRRIRRARHKATVTCQGIIFMITSPGAVGDQDSRRLYLARVSKDINLMSVLHRSAPTPIQPKVLADH